MLKEIERFIKSLIFLTRKCERVDKTYNSIIGITFENTCVPRHIFFYTIRCLLLRNISLGFNNMIDSRCKDTILQNELYTVYKNSFHINIWHMWTTVQWYNGMTPAAQIYVYFMQQIFDKNNKFLSVLECIKNV